MPVHRLQPQYRLTIGIDDLHRAVVVLHLTVGRSKCVEEVRFVDIGRHQAELILPDDLLIVYTEHGTVLENKIVVPVVDIWLQGEHLGTGSEALDSKLLKHVDNQRALVMEGHIEQRRFRPSAIILVIDYASIRFGVEDLAPRAADVEALLQLADTSSDVLRDLNAFRQRSVDVVVRSDQVCGNYRAIIVVASVRERGVTRQVDRIVEIAGNVRIIYGVVAVSFGHNISPERNSRNESEHN